MISNLKILLIVLMIYGAFGAAVFVFPFPYSLIASAAATFFIIKHFIKKWYVISAYSK
jgi:hypothetical protein